MYNSSFSAFNYSSVELKLIVCSSGSGIDRHEDDYVLDDYDDDSD